MYKIIIFTERNKYEFEAAKCHSDENFIRFRVGEMYYTFRKKNLIGYGIEDLTEE